MNIFFKENWFKLTLVAILLMLVSAIVYYLLVVIPQKDKVNQVLKENDRITELKEKCKVDGQKMYQQEEKYYGSGNAFEPKYFYNKDLNKCLYSGGGYTSQNSWERHVKDTSTNDTLDATFNLDMNKTDNITTNSINIYWDEEKKLMGEN